MPFLQELIPEVFNELADRMTSTDLPGLTTGFNLLDEMLGGGLQRQRLSYLVGDSGVGKSWLATWIAIQGAKGLLSDPTKRPRTGYILEDESDPIRVMVKDKTDKLPVIVFWSLEMAELPIITRIITQVAEAFMHTYLDSGKLMQGKLGAPIGTPEWNVARDACTEVYKYIVEELGKYVYLEFEATKPSEMERVLDSLCATRDVCMLVVDYFRLIDQVAIDGNMTTQQADRSTALKTMMRKYDCHVMSIFDINREGQKAAGPQTYHMRGGVAAHYDADLVLTLAKGEDSQPGDGHVMLRVAKGRYVGQSEVELKIELSSGKVELWNQRDDRVYDEGRDDG